MKNFYLVLSGEYRKAPELHYFEFKEEAVSFMEMSFETMRGRIKAKEFEVQNWWEHGSNNGWSIAYKNKQGDHCIWWVKWMSVNDIIQGDAPAIDTALNWIWRHSKSNYKVVESN